jgi:hypothetical protein
MTESTVTLSKETMGVLKNFYSINDNLLIKKGNRLRTMSTMKTILGEVEIQESFPKDFGIYYLSEFLTILKLMNKPTLDFSNDGWVVIKDDDHEVEFYDSDLQTLTLPPEKLNQLKYETPIPIPKSTISSIKRFGKQLSLTDLIISSSGDKEIQITVVDNLKSNSHRYSKVLNVDEPVKEFEQCLKVDYLKMIPNDYEFYNSSGGVTKWVGSTGTYWIAGEM